MKGINEIKLYLGSGNALSVQVAKDILPFYAKLHFVAHYKTLAKIHTVSKLDDNYVKISLHPCCHQLGLKVRAKKLLKIEKQAK